MVPQQHNITPYCHMPPSNWKLVLFVTQTWVEHPNTHDYRICAAQIS